LYSRVRYYRVCYKRVRSKNDCYIRARYNLVLYKQVLCNWVCFNMVVVLLNICSFYRLKQGFSNQGSRPFWESPNNKKKVIIHWKFNLAFIKIFLQFIFTFICSKERILEGREVWHNWTLSVPNSYLPNFGTFKKNHLAVNLI